MRTTIHTVTEPIYGDPRPMSEAPRDGTRIFVLWASGYVEICYGRRNHWVDAQNEDWETSNFVGWWPLPKV